MHQKNNGKTCLREKVEIPAVTKSLTSQNQHKSPILLHKIRISDGFFWGAVSKGWQNLPPLVGIGLTDLQNIGGAIAPPTPPSSGIIEYRTFSLHISRSSH